MTRRIEPRHVDAPTSEYVSLSEHVDVVMENRKTVFCTAAAIFLLGLAYAVLAPPVYRADAMIQVEDPNSSNTSSPTPWQNKDASTPFDPAAATAAESELIRSRAVIRPTVKALNLRVDATPQ